MSKLNVYDNNIFFENFQSSRSNDVNFNDCIEAKMVFYPVDDLRDDMICLQLDHTCDARPEKRWLPAYYFNICLLDGTKIGHCDLRIGHNDKTYVGGNIGYGICKKYGFFLYR
jgi:predicted acetyltransferase